jgi:translation initiation factor IF-3
MHGVQGFLHVRSGMRVPLRPARGGPGQAVGAGTTTTPGGHISTELRINERIRVPEIRLVGPNGEQVGIVSINDALRLAQEADLDLVEVAPTARPPVCKLMDYGKFKYESAVKARESRKNQAQTVIKEIKLRPKIDPHDYGTKKGHVERFLRQGDKVKVTIMFRGREQSRPELGYRLLQRLASDIEELGFVESAPKQDGRNMIMVIGPHKRRAEPRGDRQQRQGAGGPGGTGRSARAAAAADRPSAGQGTAAARSAGSGTAGSPGVAAVPGTPAGSGTSASAGTPAGTAVLAGGDRAVSGRPAVSAAAAGLGTAERAQPATPRPAPPPRPAAPRPSRPAGAGSPPRPGPPGATRPTARPPVARQGPATSHGAPARQPADPAGPALGAAGQARGTGR